MRKTHPALEPTLQLQAFQGHSRSDTHCQGFIPAFQDAETGETHLSLTAEGSPAPIHLLEGLPTRWILERDPRGRVSTVKAGIVAGFMRNGRFYTRQELAARPLDA